MGKGRSPPDGSSVHGRTLDEHLRVEHLAQRHLRSALKLLRHLLLLPEHFPCVAALFPTDSAYYSDFIL